MLPLAGQPSCCFALQEVPGEGLKLEVHPVWGERGGGATLGQRVNMKSAGTAVFDAAWEETPVTNVPGDAKRWSSECHCQRRKQSKDKFFQEWCLLFETTWVQVEDGCWEGTKDGKAGPNDSGTGVGMWKLRSCCSPLHLTCHEDFTWAHLPLPYGIYLDNILEVVMLPSCVYMTARSTDPQISKCCSNTNDPNKRSSKRLWSPASPGPGQL